MNEDIPDFLRIPQAERNASWKGRKLTRQGSAFKSAPTRQEEATGAAETSIQADTRDADRLATVAAELIRDAKRNVALASDDARLAVFQQAAAKLSEAVAGQWLPKNIMVDRLNDIAAAHGFFGREASDIETMIGGYCEKIPAPISVVVLPPILSQPEKLPRRLISHRASDLKA